MKESEMARADIIKENERVGVLEQYKNRRRRTKH